MRKFFVLLSTLSIILALITIYSPLTSANTETVVVTGDIVNIREEPNTASPIISQVKKGETFPVIAMNNDWYEIKLSNNQSGWIAGWLVNKEVEAAIAMVTANSLNVRAEPGLSGDKIGLLQKGDQVKLLSEENGWSQIEYNSNTAWVSSKYLEITSPTSDGLVKTSQGQQIEILFDATNIREKPTIKSKIVKQVSSGHIFKMLDKEGDWYKIQYENNKIGYVASWIVSDANALTTSKNIDLNSNKRSIVIDPGHGGRDQGATGVNGTLEKDLTIRMAEILSYKLERAGYNVILTRHGEEYVSLQERSETSKTYNADAFLSLHFDSIDVRSVSGHTSYYYHDRDKKLAETIHDAISKKVNIYDRGVRFGDYFVIRQNTQPAVLLELGFLSNPKEEKLIKTEKYQQKVADAIVEGLNRYFNE